MNVRLSLWLVITIFGIIANVPAVVLPLVTPFLPGHIALLLLVRVFGFGPALLALPLVCMPVLDLQIVLISLLQIGLLHISLHHFRFLRHYLVLWFLPSHFIVVWGLLPAALQSDWVQLLNYNLLAAAMFWFNLSASSLIANLATRPYGRRTNSSMANRLANQLTLYSILPATILLAVILHAATVLDLSQHLLALQSEQKQLANQISTKLAGYVADASVVSRHISAAATDTQRNALKLLTEHRDEYISALITDPAGNVQAFYKADVPATNTVRSVADREYFVEGMRTNEPYISNTFIGRGLGTDPLLAISNKLSGPPGGVLALSVNLSALTKAIHIDDIAVSHRVLLDRSQQKIWATNDNRPLGQVWSVSSRSKAMAEPFLSHSLFNTFGPVTLSNDGVHFLLSWTLPSSNWQLLYYEDTALHIPRYQAYFGVTLFLAMFLLKLNTFLTRRFASGFTKMLSNLAEQASRWQAGQTLSVRPLDCDVNEINSLADTLKAMQQRVSDSYQAQQQALQQLVQLNAELEQRVSQRTAELAEERDRAQHLATVKSRFLANMSHEIRTPITVISGFAEQLGNQLDGEAAQMLDKIRINSRYLQQLVDDILDTARIEEGKMQVAPEAFVLGPLLDEICEQISPLIDKKQLQLQREYPLAYSMEITADPFRLRQILLNLTSNAIKFTAQGRIQLVFAQHENSATLSVIDDGIGIDEAQQQHLFTQFSQADNSTSRHFGGSGLGLYISRQLAQAMQMDISVNSRPQCGATFSLHLPAHLYKQIPNQLVPLQDTKPMQTLATTLPVARIMLVDDVDDIRTLLISYLRNQPVTISEAASGQDALQLFKASNDQPYDLIVLDQQMPGLDGMHTAIQLRQLGCRAVLLLLSADVLELPTTSEALFSQVLTKPISQQVFVQTLANLLHQQWPLPELSASDGDEQDELAEEYRQSFQVLADKLLQADLNELSLLAHKIKGTSACFGMSAISAAALHLQQQLKTNAAHQQALQTLLTLLQQEAATPKS